VTFRVRPAIRPGRRVLRRQADGSFSRDWVYLALVVIGVDPKTKEPITEAGVPRWGSSDNRVKAEDFWVDYVTAVPDTGA
jgi:hypothetical protein